MKYWLVSSVHWICCITFSVSPCLAGGQELVAALGSRFSMLQPECQAHLSRAPVGTQFWSEGLTLDSHSASTRSNLPPQQPEQGSPQPGANNSQASATANPAQPQNGQTNTGGETGSSSDCKTPQQLTISPQEVRIAPGGTVTFTATGANKCPVPGLTWSTDDGSNTPSQLVTMTPSTKETNPGGSASITLTLEDKREALTSKNGTTIFVTAKSDSDADSGSKSSSSTSATATLVITTDAPGNIVVPVIGFEQAGASAAQSSQKFFFSLFVSRPLPFGKDLVEDNRVNLGTNFRWFGRVRIASYPQQISTPVAEFATGFAGEVGKLQVNQLAQSGEFDLGLDWRLAKTTGPWRLLPSGVYGIGDSEVSEYSWLSVVAGFGAISPLNPSQSLQIFVTPPVGSPQRTEFLNLYPGSANSTYTGFVSPDRGRFYWEYGAGLRLTTLYFNRSNTIGAVSPAMLTYTLGQNQLVSAGTSSGVVQRVEGFMPLPLGERFAKSVTTLYLFGRVDMRLAHSENLPTFVLQPAPSTVNGYDSDVNIVTAASNRDLYTIGVGVDAVGLIKTMTGQNKNKSKTTSKTSTPSAPNEDLNPK